MTKVDKSPIIHNGRYIFINVRCLTCLLQNFKNYVNILYIDMLLTNISNLLTCLNNSRRMFR